jgi:hypothetical protein
MAISGDESSEEELAMEKNEWTKIEQDLLDTFGEQINTALTKIDEWLNKCKDYENQTRDDLFGNYKVVEDCLLGFLKNNRDEKANGQDSNGNESKNAPCQRIMAERTPKLCGA